MFAKTLTVLALGLALNGVLLNGPAGAQEVIRHRTPGSNFPIAAAVEVPAGKTIVFVSGMATRVINEQAPRNSTASFGSKKAQTVSVLQAIEGAIQRMNLSMKDALSLKAFVVSGP